MKIMISFGTRPEVIKFYPIIKELENKDVEVVICNTQQHKEMVNQLLSVLDVKPKYSLNIMKENQTISYINSKIIEKMDVIIKDEKPDLMLVQGDTTTALASAQVAFYNRIKVAHVEAGLRSNDKYSPFPEELNRCLISKIADIHFAPTDFSRQNLIKEGINEKDIFVTGNTVIDMVKYTVSKNKSFDNELLKKLDFEGKKVICLTTHRRENIGCDMENIFKAVNIILENRADVEVVFPLHLNPKIRSLAKMYLVDERVHLIQPLEIFDMHNLMSRCKLIMTDSGGIQEEAVALSKPTLVLRKNTERPEALDSGIVKVVRN